MRASSKKSRGSKSVILISQKGILSPCLPHPSCPQYLYIYSLLVWLLHRCGNVQGKRKLCSCVLIEAQERGQVPCSYRSADTVQGCTNKRCLIPTPEKNFTKRGSHNSKMETWRCWDLNCCHLHPVSCSALHSSKGAAFLCTPSSS